ncbi:hypothetical protein ATW7_00005, partial [Alteromonadales bacterium TW-7]
GCGWLSCNCLASELTITNSTQSNAKQCKGCVKIHF